MTTTAATSTAVQVRHCGGDQFEIDIRGHTLHVDQPVEAGGEDTAPTPTELLVASLSSCVAFYARRYLLRHGLPSQGLIVRADFDMAAHPARVASITVSVAVPPGVPESRRTPLLAVASHCTVHHTMTDPPRISVVLT